MLLRLELSSLDRQMGAAFNTVEGGWGFFIVICVINLGKTAFRGFKVTIVRGNYTTYCSEIEEVTDKTLTAS